MTSRSRTGERLRGAQRNRAPGSKNRAPRWNNRTTRKANRGGPQAAGRPPPPGAGSLPSPIRPRCQIRRRCGREWPIEMTFSCESEPHSSAAFSRTGLPFPRRARSRRTLVPTGASRSKRARAGDLTSADLLVDDTSPRLGVVASPPEHTGVSDVFAGRPPTAAAVTSTAPVSRPGLPCEGFQSTGRNLPMSLPCLLPHDGRAAGSPITSVSRIDIRNRRSVAENGHIGDL